MMTKVIPNYNCEKCFRLSYLLTKVCMDANEVNRTGLAVIHIYIYVYVWD